MTNIPYGDPGMASSANEEFVSQELLSGDFPLSTTPEVVASAVIASADLPAFTVVGRNGSGELVKAVYGSIAPVGITTAKVLEGATDAHVAIYRSGMFNPAALNWDSSYNTAAKKRLAFEASQPTIFIRDVLYQG